MAPYIQSVAIMIKRDNSEAEAAAEKVAGLLAKNNIKTYAVSPLKIDGAIQIEHDELNKVKLDLMFAVGGDGTTLRAFRVMPAKVPLFSINSGGHRGILSEIGPDSIEQAFHAIFAGNY